MAHTAPCDHLLAIIDTQNEIVANDLGLDAIMRLVADRSRSLTGAQAVVLELTEGEAATRLTSADDGVDADSADGPVIFVALRDGETSIGTIRAYAAPSHAFFEADEQTLELLARLLTAQLAQATGSFPAGDESRDEVTELPNRKAFEGRLARESERARRYRYPLALLLIDVETLNALDEEFGPGAGDDLAREVATVLGGSRFADEAFRIESSVFAILLPHTDLAGAEAAAARLVMQISADGHLTASWGAASDAGHPATLYDRAARSLAAAKAGRERAGSG